MPMTQLGERVQPVLQPQRVAPGDTGRHGRDRRKAANALYDGSDDTGDIGRHFRGQTQIPCPLVRVDSTPTFGMSRRCGRLRDLRAGPVLAGTT